MPEVVHVARSEIGKVTLPNHLVNYAWRAADGNQMQLDKSTLHTCQICGREVKKKPTQHHLIPRTCHKNRWFQKQFTREQMRETVRACADCHREIHRLIPREKDLGREYFTLERLLAHPQMAKFVKWVQKQK